jgi:hypothetical protein
MTLVWRPGYDDGSTYTPGKLVLKKESQTLDADAEAYVNAVEVADGQRIEDPVRFAINDFVIGCKADGIWTAIKASCILAGARTLNGALVPLVGTAPTNFNFVSGDYNRKTGLVGDGSTKYLDSNRNNNADPQNSKHVSVCATSKNTETSVRAYIAVFQAPPAGSTQILSGLSASKLSSRLNTVSTISSSGNLHASNGLFGISRSTATTYEARGSATTEVITASSSTAANGNIFVFARNEIALPGVDSYSNARLAFYSIGESLDLALLDARVTTLINAFAAAIP